LTSRQDALLETLAGHLRTVESILLNSTWQADETAQARLRETWSAFDATLRSAPKSDPGRPMPVELQPLLASAEKLLEQVRAAILIEGIEEAKKMLDRSAATRAESSYLYSQQTSSPASRIDFKG